MPWHAHLIIDYFITGQITIWRLYRRFLARLSSLRIHRDTGEEMRAGESKNVVILSHGRDGEGADGEVLQVSGGDVATALSKEQNSWFHQQKLRLRLRMRLLTLPAAAYVCSAVCTLLALTIHIREIP